ncbi:MAG: sigma-70 family RNA polymerase sigma factor [Candidatus Eremiobacteraeota bacterium]|nr:sigma-70 family RNA polymerase sigma factor [Candidatus Eremiobacteraeota bacterium]
MAEPDERETRIRALLPLVRKIARRVRRLVPNADLHDLIGDGSVGLIRAVDSYDASRGPSLEQYAGRIVAGAMLNGIRRLDPVSERVRREIREAERDRYALATQRGSLPSLNEMERRRPTLGRARFHAYRNAPVSLDAPLPSGEQLPEDWAADPSIAVITMSEHRALRARICRLPDRLKRLLALHYYDGIPLRAISRAMRVSPQRVSQLHLSALQRLRKSYADTPHA